MAYFAYLGAIKRQTEPDEPRPVNLLDIYLERDMRRERLTNRPRRS